MRTKRIPTIRARLVLLVMACILPASLMVAALISYNYSQGRAQLVREATATARALMSAVDSDFAATQAALLALATSPYLDTNDFSAFYAEAKEVLKSQNATNIVLTDPASRQLLNTLLPYGSALPSARAAVALRIFETGRPVTGNLVMGAVAQKPLFATAVPVRRGAATIYVLVATIFPERVFELLTQQRLPEDWDGVIVDGAGTIVARNHLMEQFVGKKAAPAVLAGMAEAGEGSLETKSVEGTPVLAVFSRSAVSGWGAGIEIPMQTLTNKLVNTLWWLVAGTALLLSGSLVLARTIGGRIAGSIHQLAAPALALGSGEAVSVPSLQTREADEVGRALTRASEMLIAAQHRANHDALTGLANRSLFDEILGRQLAICERTKANLAVLYIDLDGFKPVNDAHGHAVGDEVLRTVARRIVDAVRRSDVAARPGGDEFAVILIHAGLEAAKGVAAKLIDSLSIPYSVGSLTLQISASIGIAAYPDSGTTGDVLSRRADEAMYKAKAAGKRCYAVAS